MGLTPLPRTLRIAGGLDGTGYFQHCEPLERAGPGRDHSGMGLTVARTLRIAGGLDGTGRRTAPTRAQSCSSYFLFPISYFLFPSSFRNLIEQCRGFVVSLACVFQRNGFVAVRESKIEPRVRFP
jgi:hypothetical protein